MVVMLHRSIAGGGSNTRKNGVSLHDGLTIYARMWTNVKKTRLTFIIIRIQVDFVVLISLKIAKIDIAESLSLKMKNSKRL